MRVMIDGMVFESREAIEAYKAHKLQELEDKFAGALGRQPTMRERDAAELAAKHDGEKLQDGWS